MKIMKHQEPDMHLSKNSRYVVFNKNGFILKKLKYIVRKCRAIDENVFKTFTTS